MKRLATIIVLMTVVAVSHAQLSPCPGLKNPASFTSGSTSGLFVGYSAGAREFVLNFDEDPSSELTGIVTVPADGRDSGSSRSIRTGIYTLDGRRVATDASGFDLKSLLPGLYIVNGKKMIIK